MPRDVRTGRWGRSHNQAGRKEGLPPPQHSLLCFRLSSSEIDRAARLGLAPERPRGGGGDTGNFRYVQRRVYAEPGLKLRP